MALTAIAQDLEGNKKLITPFKMVESSGVTKATEVYQALEAEKKSGIQFYCGDCYLDQDKLIDVVFRRTDARKTRPHFAHIGANGGCVGSNPETVKHRTTKTVLATYLQEKGGRVEVEYTLNTGQAQLRRPDVFAEFVDRVEAHEIQVSPINGGEISQRTDDLLAHLKHRFPEHVAIVYWYLAPRNQKPDNWSSFNFVDRHGLILDFDKVTGAPIWQSYRPHFEAEKKRQQETAAQERRKKKEKADRWKLRSQTPALQVPCREVLDYQKAERRQAFEQRVQNAQAWYQANRQNIIDAIAASESQQLPVTAWSKVTSQAVDSLDEWEKLLQDSPPNLVDCYYLRPLRKIKEALAVKQRAPL